MIRRIRISRFKSFEEAEVTLSPFTCIFGPNAAGKSNLVELLGFLSRASTAHSIRDAFSGNALECFHWPKGFSDAGIRSLLKQENLSFEVEVDLELSNDLVTRANEELKEREALEEKKGSYTRVSERWLRYRLSIGLTAGEPQILDESLIAIKKSGDPRPNRPPFIVRKPKRYVVHLEKQRHPRYFPINRTSTLLSEISDIVNHPHLVAAKREISSWRTYQVDPGRIRRETGLLGAADPGHHGEDIVPFYYQLKNQNPDLFSEVVQTLRDIVPTLKDIDVREIRPGVLDLYVQEPTGSFPLRLVSEGTLRLMAILAASASLNKPSLVIYEDPEANVHPHRLRQVVDLLRRLSKQDTQVLITTHSPPLLDLISA
ncbi:MAG: AAA family ATPase, partial [Deltaproteobacteria bacterium]|nr:AAA family ATPase [Deltaproteobacteria bacterium]